MPSNLKVFAEIVLEQIIMDLGQFFKDALLDFNL